jgi:hypothetical protein
MIPAVRDAIREVCTERGINPHLIVSICRTDMVSHARAEVAARLFKTGRFSVAAIARALHRDHSTITYYFGQLRRKPKPLRWRKPRVKHVEWLERPPLPPGPPQDYLKPYAGADAEYHWKERPPCR